VGVARFREEESVLRDLRLSIGRHVTVKSDIQLHHEHFDVIACLRTIACFGA
jgi:hypothetical protein